MVTKTLADFQKEFYEEAAGRIPDPADWVFDSDTGTAGAQVQSSLPAVSGKRNYLLGCIVTATNPAAAVNGVITVTGLGVTLSFQFVEATTIGGQLVVQFSTPIPASALNAAIVVTLPAIATGGAGAVAVWGFAKTE